MQILTFVIIKKMKIFSVLIYILLFYTKSFCQVPNLKWAQAIGSKYYDHVFAVCTDSKGNVYSTGFFSDTVDFDPGAGTYYLISKDKNKFNDDIFIQKLDSNGKFVWAIAIGSSGGDDEGTSIKVDSKDNIYITGCFRNTIDFDPGTNKFYMYADSYYSDIFVLKLSSSGTFRWAKDFGNKTQNIWTEDIQVDSKCNVYMSGHFSGTMDFDLGSGTYNMTSKGNDPFIIKMDSAGNFIWARQLSTRKNSALILAMGIDSKDNIYATGQFAGSDIDLDPGTDTFYCKINGYNDIFVVKLNSSGNFKWGVSIGGKGEEKGLGISIDLWGNVYTSGYFSVFNDSLDFDPGKGVKYIKNKGTEDAFVLKLDSSGKFKWVNHIGSIIDDIAYNVKTDKFGAVYSIGKFGGKLDFDPSTKTWFMNGSKGFVYVQKLDTTGSLIWAAQGLRGGSDYSYDYIISLDKRGNLLLAGGFTDSADCEPDTTKINNVYSKGSLEGFMVKWSQCNTTKANIYKTVCDFYMINSKPYFSSGIYTINLVNKAGCDSIVTLYLTVKKSTSVTLKKTECDSFILNGKIYYNSGTYYDTLINNVGCDSTITLSLKVIKGSDTTINVTACDSFRINNLNYYKTGKYSQVVFNNEGCDSTIVLNLIIKKSSDYVLNKNACNSFELNGKTYTTDGTYKQLLKNHNNCDSIITLNLIIQKTSYGTLNLKYCDTAKINNIIYSSSGVFTQTLINEAGCDSNLTLNLTLNKSSKYILEKTSCRLFSLNNKTYNKSGEYMQILTNSQSCDSLINLKLNIINIDTTVTRNWKTLTATIPDATYQWLDCSKNKYPIHGATTRSYSFETIGSYAVAITRENCADTSACHVVNTMQINRMSWAQSISYSPNPVIDYLNIITPKIQGDVRIRCFDITGQLLFEEKRVSNGNLLLDLSLQPPGYYIIELRNNSFCHRLKINKN